MICSTRRAVATALLAVSAVVGLSSCSGLGAGAAGAQSSSPSRSAAVVDPSVQQSSAVPTESTVVPSTGDSPTPTPTPTASPSESAALKKVAPFITSATSSAGAIAVTALVPGVVEQGGTCTLVATKGGTTRQASSGAVAASSYTGCNPLEIPAAQLGAGTWSVQVTYRSATSSGPSGAKTVEVG